MITASILPVDGLNELFDFSVIVCVGQMADDRLDNYKEVLLGNSFSLVTATLQVIEIVGDLVFIVSEGRAKPSKKVRVRF